MDGKKFNYGNAEADLYEAGCPCPEEIYGYRTEEGVREFMHENGLDPDHYYEKPCDPYAEAPKHNENDGGCYLTGACVRSRGLADDCDELTILRHYRDTYLVHRAGGSADIARYYKSAPVIVERINAQPDPAAIWDKLYETLVRPCVEFIRQGKNEEAYQVYKSVTLQLENEYVDK